MEGRAESGKGTLLSLPTFRETAFLPFLFGKRPHSGCGEQEATQGFAGRGLAGFLQEHYTLTVRREKLRARY